MTNRSLMSMPAVIDPHVHFRVPGHAHKEDWTSAALAAISGGVTTVFDMPNNSPPAVDLPSILAKKELIDRQLIQAKIPLRYQLWLGADKDHLNDIASAKPYVIGIKIYMGSSTGGLLMDDPQVVEKVFQIAAKNDMLVAVHAEDEPHMQKLKSQYAGISDPAVHSKIRDRKCAVIAVNAAIALSEKYRTKLYIVHISTKEELELIRRAKKDRIPVFAEVTPHHLHLTDEDYQTQSNFVKVNPPIRTHQDVDALWQGIADGTVDTIGSDHAPHTIEEKQHPYSHAPSGVPGVEMILPLLLNAYNEGKISLEKIIQVTSTNPMRLFNLPQNTDHILVDLQEEKLVKNEHMKTKCGWSPYAGRVLKGWPKFTIFKGETYEI